MAGNRDAMKWAIVRQTLRTKWGQENSDRAVALELGLSRGLVSMVRRTMIAAKEIPARGPIKFHGDRKCYEPGSTVRGGYVWTGRKVVRETEWLRRGK